MHKYSVKPILGILDSLVKPINKISSNNHILTLGVLYSLSVFICSSDLVFWKTHCKLKSQLILRKKLHRINQPFIKFPTITLTFD